MAAPAPRSSAVVAAASNEGPDKKAAAAGKRPCEDEERAEAKRTRIPASSALQAAACSRSQAVLPAPRKSVFDDQGSGGHSRGQKEGGGSGSGPSGEGAGSVGADYGALYPTIAYGAIFDEKECSTERWLVRDLNFSVPQLNTLPAVVGNTDRVKGPDRDPPDPHDDERRGMQNFVRVEDEGLGKPDLDEAPTQQCLCCGTQDERHLFNLRFEGAGCGNCGKMADGTFQTLGRTAHFAGVWFQEELNKDTVQRLAALQHARLTQEQMEGDQYPQLDYLMDGFYIRRYFHKGAVGPYDERGGPLIILYCVPHPLADLTRDLCEQFGIFTCDWLATGMESACNLLPPNPAVFQRTFIAWNWNYPDAKESYPELMAARRHSK